jgi:hypothetical protein
MWWHSRTRYVLTVVVAVIGFVGASPATSAGALAAGAPSKHSLQAEIKLLDRYVVTDGNGTLALSPPAAVARQVDPADLTMLLNGLAVANQKVQSGELVITSGHQLVDPKSVGFNIQWNWTGRVYHWWGLQSFFSEYYTLKLEGLYTMGAGAAGICAAIAGALGAAPVALICGMAAAILAFGVGWLMWADNGGGDIISQTWTPFPFGGAWINGQ